MDKLSRARMIKGQVLSLNETRGRPVRENGGQAVPGVRVVDVPGHWNATITLSQAQATKTDRDWNLLHLHAEGELKFAARYDEDDLEIIVFLPDKWELWFGTYDSGDTTAIFPGRR